MCHDIWRLYERTINTEAPTPEAMPSGVVPKNLLAIHVDLLDDRVNRMGALDDLHLVVGTAKNRCPRQFESIF